jgi:hypothetical protein
VYIDNELLQLSPSGVHYKPGVLYGEIYELVGAELDKSKEPQGGVHPVVQDLKNANMDFLEHVMDYIDNHPGPSAHDEL